MDHANSCAINNNFVVRKHRIHGCAIKFAIQPGLTHQFDL